MKNELMSYTYDFSTRVHDGELSHQDPDKCACRGSGWILSSLDTWEQCPFHEGIHPEDYDYQEDEERQYSSLYESQQPVIYNDDDIPF